MAPVRLPAPPHPRSAASHGHACCNSDALATTRLRASKESSWRRNIDSRWRRITDLRHRYTDTTSCFTGAQSLSKRPCRVRGKQLQLLPSCGDIDGAALYTQGRHEWSPTRNSTGPTKCSVPEHSARGPSAVAASCITNAPVPLAEELTVNSVTRTRIHDLDAECAVCSK